MKNLKPVALALLLVIAGYEGFSSTPYQDQAGVWTNGYGETAGVTASTPAVTERAAMLRLDAGVSRRATQIDACLTEPATQGQTDAYVSLAYNIGVPAFCGSSVARLHNQRSFVEACKAILMWDKITVHGRKVKNKGLANRRAKEQATCLIKP